MNATSTDPIVGQLVGGRFRVEKRLAAGGMGVVYKAEQIPLGRSVAVKILRHPPDATQEDSFSKRFLLEAAAVANLSHPHTVIVHDYGRDAELLYFAMEFLDGATLTRHVRKGGPMAPRDAIHVARQMASSLRDAHAQNLVHRDLKPGNVMLIDRGEDPLFVKVLDFGLVKIVSEQENVKLTQSGIMLGSPRYMAPEQVKGDAIDFRADIYSFGAVLFFMLTGKAPFGAGSQFEAMRAHVYTPAPALREVLPECNASDRVQAVVARCLLKPKEDRFQSMQELIDALDHCALAPEADDDFDAKATSLRPAPSAAVPAELIPVSPPPPAPEPSELGTAPTEQPPPPPRKRRGVHWAVYAGLGLGLLGLLGFGALGWSLFQATGPTLANPSLPSLGGSQEHTATPEHQGTHPSAGNVAEPVEAPPTEPAPSDPAPSNDGPETPASAIRVFTLQSNPSGARVLHDGQDLGDTPMNLRVPPGEHWRLHLERDGYAAQEISVSEHTQDLVIQLEQAPEERSARPATRPSSTRVRAVEAPTGPAPQGNDPIRDPWGP